MDFTGTVEIDAPRAAVWDLLLDFEQLAQCGPGVQSIERLDETHARVGFKANRQDRWTFSKPFDSAKAFGPIGKLAYPCLVSFQGRHVGNPGWGAGNYPRYQKFKIDYWHYRYARSE